MKISTKMNIGREKITSMETVETEILFTSNFFRQLPEIQPQKCLLDYNLTFPSAPTMLLNSQQLLEHTGALANETWSFSFIGVIPCLQKLPAVAYFISLD